MRCSDYSESLGGGVIPVKMLAQVDKLCKSGCHFVSMAEFQTASVIPLSVLRSDPLSALNEPAEST